MEFSGEEILFLLIVIAVNLYIIYLIIQAAVRSATVEIKNNIAILVRLKYLELNKQGITLEEMKKEVDKVYQVASKAN